jgi:hypothetical protein
MNAPPRGGRQPCRKHRPFPMPGRNRSGFHPRAWSECSLPSSAKPARRPFPASPCWWRGTDRSAGLMRSAGRAGSNHGRCSGADPVLAGSVVHLGSNVAPDPPKSAFRAAHWPPAARVTFGMIFRARAPRLSWVRGLPANAARFCSTITPASASAASIAGMPRTIDKCSPAIK